MNTRNSLSVFDNFMNEFQRDLARTFVGFDSIFDGFRNTLGAYDSYPPYNVEKVSDDEYRVTLALAGFGKDDVEVTKEGDMLVITGKIESKSADEGQHYLHRGIAARAFTRRVQLAGDIEVTGANMENGLLYIDLVRIVPEEKKPRKIEISGPSTRVKSRVAKPKSDE